MNNSMDLQVESLETRQMMAGDVSVSINGGDLVINGDGNNNELIIMGTGSDGEFDIYGANGTSVNGQSLIHVAGVDDDFRINLRDGNNKLGMRDLEVPDDLRIRSRGGNDEIGMEDVTIGDDVDIRTGKGNDTVFLKTGAADRIRVSTGAGADDVVLTKVRADRASVNTGSGNDQFAIVENVFEARATAILGAGDDLAFQTQTVGQLRVNGSGGNDGATFDIIAGRGFEFDGVVPLSAELQIDAATGLVNAHLELGVS